MFHQRICGAGQGGHQRFSGAARLEHQRFYSSNVRARANPCSDEGTSEAAQQRGHEHILEAAKVPGHKRIHVAARAQAKQRVHERIVAAAGTPPIMVFGKGFKRKKSRTAQKRKGGHSYANWQAASSETPEAGDGNDLLNGDDTQIDNDGVGMAEEVGNSQDAVPHLQPRRESGKVMGGERAVLSRL